MNAADMKAQPFEVTTEVNPQNVSDTLVSGLEGGTGYWAQIDNEKGPDYDEEMADKIVAARGFLLITDTDSGKSYKLDRKAVARGVKIMARDYANHYADMVSEDGSMDATTGDVLIQCALLGEVIYG